MLPHAPMMERSVLSCLMKSADLLEEFPLEPEIFHLPAHREIYRVLRETRDGDLVRIVSKLQERGLLENIGGPSAVTEVYTYAPGERYFARHLQILRDRHARRRAVVACQAAIEKAQDCSGEEGDADFLDALAGPVSAVFDTMAAAEAPADTKALAREFLDAYERRVAGVVEPGGLPTGIAEVDRHLHGLQPRQMGIISARSGGGKSTMATQMAAKLAVAGAGVLYLILERTEQSAFQRAVVQTAGVHHRAVADPRGHAREQGMTKPEHRTLVAIDRALKDLAAANLHIRKPANRRLATVCAEIRRYRRVHGVQVIFLDQIGLVRGERARGDTQEAELRGISNTLQELCHELGTTIIVLSQVSEEGETKGARAVEEDADWWLSIIQERDRTKANFGEHQHVMIAKDSHHGTAGLRLPLILDHATLRFIPGYPAVKEEPVRKGRFG